MESFATPYPVVFCDGDQVRPSRSHDPHNHHPPDQPRLKEPGGTR